MGDEEVRCGDFMTVIVCFVCRWLSVVAYADADVSMQWKAASAGSKVLTRKISDVVQVFDVSTYSKVLRTSS